jgi:hypothetical protein
MEGGLGASKSLCVKSYPQELPSTTIRLKDLRVEVSDIGYTSEREMGALDRPGPLRQTGEVRKWATVLSKLREAPFNEDRRDKSPVAIDEDKQNAISVCGQDQGNRAPTPCDTGSIP